MRLLPSRIGWRHGLTVWKQRIDVILTEIAFDGIEP